jgi:hypothetical protein
MNFSRMNLMDLVGRGISLVIAVQVLCYSCKTAMLFLLAADKDGVIL